MNKFKSFESWVPCVWTLHALSGKIFEGIERVNIPGMLLEVFQRHFQIDFLCWDPSRKTFIHFSFTIHCHIYFWNPSKRKKVYFCYRILVFRAKSLLLEVNQYFQKRLYAWKNFKNIFSRPLFTVIFRYIFHFEQVRMTKVI